jgi:MFS superfamily sulfate permease-like transporter
VLIGAALSLLILLRRSSQPHSTELGRIPGTNYFADLQRDPQNQREPGVFVFRAESAILYYNTEYVRDRFFALLDARGQGIKLAVFFLGTSPMVDLAGTEMLTELHHTLRARGIELGLAEMHGQVREALRRADFEKHCGPVETYQTVSAVIQKWRDGTLTTPSA